VKKKIKRTPCERRPFVKASFCQPDGTGQQAHEKSLPRLEEAFFKYQTLREPFPPARKII
jgi:hypothetical protein